MITRRSTGSLLLLALACAGSAACSDDAPDGPNPSRLWLALDRSELQVRLIPVQPPNF